ncbi:MAG TPA: hypothetical protein VFU15_08620 [Bacteroidia bacterium]|nr:hypothetical protein [Bacteroidia bacterium]
MSEIKNISGRASFVKTEAETSIVITSGAENGKKRITGIILLLWIIGGLYVVINLFTIKQNNTMLVVVIWVAFWIYFAYVMGKSWMWLRKGREVMKIRDGKLFYKRDVGGRGWVHEFAVDRIRNLRPAVSKNPAWLKQFGGDYWSTDCDSMVFNYDDREIAFGFRLDEKEMKKISQLILGTPKKRPEKD